MGALIAVGADELTDMIERDGGAEIRCHFCNACYRFTAEQLGALLERAKGNVHGNETAKEG